MARIRSIHPGFATDEVLVSVSIPARLFLVLLWGECWDDGVFEWKPAGLKIRLMPVDGVDVAEILTELESADIVRRFTAGGKVYGVVRNFQRYQKPKKPNSSKVLPQELHEYAGASKDDQEPGGDGGDKAKKPARQAFESSEPVRNQFRTNPKQVPLGEGVGEGEGERDHTPPLAQTSHVQAHAREAPARGGAGLDLRKEILSAFQYAGCPHIPDTARAEVWLAQGYSPELILATIRDVLVRKPDVTSLAYFDPALRRAKDSAPKAALPESSEDVERRDRQRIELWLRNDNWPGAWGDPPGHPRCTLPRHLIDDALRRRAEGLRGAA